MPAGVVAIDIGESPYNDGFCWGYSDPFAGGTVWDQWMDPFGLRRDRFLNRHSVYGLRWSTYGTGGFSLPILSNGEVVNVLRGLGFDGVMLVAKQPHVSLLDYDAAARKALRQKIKKLNLELVCLGDKAYHIVNGHIVLVVEQSVAYDENDVATPMTKGKIQIQSESAEILIRRIELRPVTGVR